MTDKQDAEQPQRVQIEWSRAIAGALAAVVSAVVLSTLGAAGTLIGAAIGSLVATVGGALFTQGIRSSSRKLADAQSAAASKVGVAQAEVIRAEKAADDTAHDSHLLYADEQLAAAKQELDASSAAAAPVPWRTRLARLPWKRILLTSLALFVVALVAITVFELLAGRSVSSITGGSDDQRTTIGNVRGGGGSGGGNDQEPDQNRPSSPGTSPSQGTSPGPADTSAPTQTPTASSTPTQTSSPTETTSPTEQPTDQASPAGGDEQGSAQDTQQ